jgi:hypothetical protein
MSDGTLVVRRPDRGDLLRKDGHEPRCGFTHLPPGQVCYCPAPVPTPTPKEEPCPRPAGMRTRSTDKKPTPGITVRSR